MENICFMFLYIEFHFIQEKINTGYLKNVDLKCDFVTNYYFY